MKKYIIHFFLVGLCSFITTAQTVTTGVFGGDAAASGFSNASNTTNKWVKIAELTLNGNYNPAGITVDFFPRNSNHGDSRQQLNVQFRNNNGSGIYTTSNDISLFHFHGQHKTVMDVKVVHTSGTAVTNNKLSVWVQMGISWLGGVPIEVRKYGNVTFEITNQPYYSAITETGTVYDLKNTVGKIGSTYTMSSMSAGDAVLRIESDTDNNNESDNSRIEMYQDGGSLGALIGFNADWPVSGGDAGNLFRIITRYSNTNMYDAFVINGQNGNVGISTSNPSERLEVNGTIRSKEVKVEASPWPDYVFSSDYKLFSLGEIEEFINANQHLPEVPSAQEVEENGISLGEMNALLLKKIEELTLYLIEVKKENSSLKARVEKIENKI